MKSVTMRISLAPRRPSSSKHENPAIAFPILEPQLFAPKYGFQLARRDLEALQMQNGEKYHCFCIITIPQDARQMTANLKAPVVINAKKRLARQCVLQDNSLAIREPIFAHLQQRFVQSPQQPIKSRVVDSGMTIRLSDSKPTKVAEV